MTTELWVELKEQIILTSISCTRKGEELGVINDLCINHYTVNWDILNNDYSLKNSCLKLIIQFMFFVHVHGSTLHCVYRNISKQHVCM